MGDDFCDGTKEAIGRIAEYEASVGVTAIAPATMTLPVEELVRILSVAAEYRREEASGQDAKIRADLVGVNMEGPFISKMKKGRRMNGIFCPVMLLSHAVSGSFRRTGKIYWHRTGGK